MYLESGMNYEQSSTSDGKAVEGRQENPDVKRANASQKLDDDIKRKAEGEEIKWIPFEQAGMQCGALNLTGVRFGRLIAIGIPVLKSGKMTRWVCRCDCGAFSVVAISSLRIGKTRSCGCLNREAASLRSTIHGGTKKSGTHSVMPEHKSWSSMKDRCLNPNNHGWKNYGGRGIKVCDRWVRFENFLADMGKRPSPKHSLDRIDVNGNYEPSNCRWATIMEQASNKRNLVVLTLLGNSKTIREWSKELGISINAIRSKLYSRKLRIDQILSTKNIASSKSEVNAVLRQIQLSTK